MAATIKIRPSYSNDANFLTRLKQAVEKDGRICTDTQGQILGSIDKLVVILIRADVELRETEIL